MKASPDNIGVPLIANAEGDHYRLDGTQFAVEWRAEPAGWYWSDFVFNVTQDFVGPLNGPFGLAENAYLDAVGAL